MELRLIKTEFTKARNGLFSELQNGWHTTTNDDCNEHHETLPKKSTCYQS